mmetsp:Transcript_16937/g.59234  ORF Transcript_16937/g.59234 Transcript_16937/m.59234 type:complete len:206 (-) Transcript_16937:50-667(-)
MLLLLPLPATTRRGRNSGEGAMAPGDTSDKCSAPPLHDAARDRTPQRARGRWRAGDGVATSRPRRCAAPPRPSAAPLHAPALHRRHEGCTTPPHTREDGARRSVGDSGPGGGGGRRRRIPASPRHRTPRQPILAPQWTATRDPIIQHTSAGATRAMAVVAVPLSSNGDGGGGASEGGEAGAVCPRRASAPAARRDRRGAARKRPA